MPLPCHNCFFNVATLKNIHTHTKTITDGKYFRNFNYKLLQIKFSCITFVNCCRNQAEMSHTCRGNISLLGALIHSVDSCTFVISNGGTQTFHIRAHDEVERQSWVTALELAKAKAMLV